MIQIKEHFGNKRQSRRVFLDDIASGNTLSTSSFQKIKWFLVAVFDAARISGAYDHNSLNPFSDVKLAKNRRPKQPGRYATLENVTDMLTTLSDVAVTRASYIKVPVATKKMAMARLDEALKVRKTRKQAK